LETSVVENRGQETVVVTGGTGHLGRDLVARLKDSYRVRVLARSTGSDPDVEWMRGDLATGEGIADALAGSQTLIHAATLSPAARPGCGRP
jgi:nucleoside-diphosphate-sugar epimerase